jgi:hypothetical protein
MLRIGRLVATSGLSTLNEDQIAERGARLARRDDREYREYLREEQRRQAGCPAREVVLDQRGQAASPRAVSERHAGDVGNCSLRLARLTMGCTRHGRQGLNPASPYPPKLQPL